MNWSKRLNTPLISLVSPSHLAPTLTLIDLALQEFDAYWCLSYFLFCHCEKKKKMRMSKL